MAVDIKNLVAAISPDVYCDSSVRSKVKQIAKDEGFLKAAEVAKVVSSSHMDFEKVDYESPFDSPGQKNPLEQHSFVYDLAGSPGQILEEVYFWLLDYLNGVYGKTDKVVDNFVTSPGSSLFTENLQKRSTAEQNAYRYLVAVNDIVKSIVQLIWSVKEYDTILVMYDKYRSKDKDEKEAALLALKQRWLDKVDIQKAGSALKQLAITGAQQPGFVLVIDAFMAAKDEKDVNKLDLNDRLKRLLKQRVAEFFVWLKDSEKGLRQRYAVEKNYLKTQMNTLQVYAHWVKPYLKAANKLRESAEETSALVNAFNTALFELTVLAQGKYDPADAVSVGDLPEFFSKRKFRVYSPILLLEMKFRSTPESVGQHARFRGRLEIKFTSFALHADEIKTLKKELEKDDLGDLIGAVEGITTESLEQIKKDVEDVLKEKKEEKKKKSSESDTNPFSALFSLFKFGDSKKEAGGTGLSSDNEYERAIRSLAIIDSRKRCRKTYNTLKKVYGLPAFNEEI